MFEIYFVYQERKYSIIQKFDVCKIIIIIIIIILKNNCNLKNVFLFFIYLKCNLFLWWENYIFICHFSSPQCHVILQKSF